MHVNNLHNLDKNGLGKKSQHLRNYEISPQWASLVQSKGMFNGSSSFILPSFAMFAIEIVHCMQVPSCNLITFGY
jgi:hypothetical protein